jgi:hypothetical protein
MELTSSAFEAGGIIPIQYTRKDKNISPELCWKHLPEGTKSLALIMEDPDAPRRPYTHWIVYNIPTHEGKLEPAQPEEKEGIMQGQNDLGKKGYGGPCPPKGDPPHRYFFNLYALDTELDLENPTRKTLESAMEGHILDQAGLMGLSAG